MKLPSVLQVLPITLLLVSSMAICGNIRPVYADQANLTRDEAIDAQTDMFLYRVNPELNGRKLGSRDYGYIQEWKSIRRAVAQEMKPRASECAGDVYWELFEYDGINGLPSARRPARSFDQIADAIFYSRHPELANNPLSSASSDLAQEWNQIREAIKVEQPCS
jgi:hypothetical protein